ncbi:MAG: hypothetical protein KBD25_04320 [Rickettsiaceae bacterium]|nr:hypothetical protein [Rickettsiaceae bacterium]
MPNQHFWVFFHRGRIIDEQNKTIELKAPNSFIKQWIETSYRDSILKVLKSLGSELKEIIIL